MVFVALSIVLILVGVISLALGSTLRFPAFSRMALLFVVGGIGLFLLDQSIGDNPLVLGFIGLVVIILLVRRGR